MTTTTDTELTDLNQFLAEVYAERRTALWAAITDRNANGNPIPSAVSDGYDKAVAMLHRSATTLAMNSPVGTPVETVDGRLIVASIGSIADAFAEAGVPLRDGGRIVVTLTEDGGIANRSFWHSTEQDGPTTESVRYEVYGMEGRTAHGYIDRKSRRITQTG